MQAWLYPGKQIKYQVTYSQREKKAVVPFQRACRFSNVHKKYTGRYPILTENEIPGRLFVGLGFRSQLIFTYENAKIFSRKLYIFAKIRHIINDSVNLCSPSPDVDGFLAPRTRLVTFEPTDNQRLATVSRPTMKNSEKEELVCCCHRKQLSG